MGKHALLSASSSHRWLACPPSARLCESYEDKGSEYAQQGTDAHSLCEYKLQKALGIKADDPTENLTYYDSEMEVCAESYADYVMEQLAAAMKNCSDPIVLIEQRLDYSRFVPEGFGTGDAVIIADGQLTICDYKHGKGVLVEAEKNPQMMCYALGALELFDALYDIDTVRMVIFQPRRENVSEYIITRTELLQWAKISLFLPQNLPLMARANSVPESIAVSAKRKLPVANAPSTIWNLQNMTLKLLPCWTMWRLKQFCLR